MKWMTRLVLVGMMAVLLVAGLGCGQSDSGNEAVEKVKDDAKELKKEMGEAADDAADAMEDGAEKMKDEAKELKKEMGEAADDMEEGAEEMKEAAKSKTKEMQEH